MPKNGEIDLKKIEFDDAFDDDEVDDLDDEYALHHNDGFGDVKDTTNDGVQHEQENQLHHFGGLIENEGEQHDYFGGPDQENVMPDHNINIDNDVVDNGNHNGMNIIPDNLSRTSSDTNKFSDTNEALLTILKTYLMNMIMMKLMLHRNHTT